MAEPACLDTITQDHELLVQLKLLETDHNLSVVEYPDVLGSPGMALEWCDLQLPAIVVRTCDYSSKEMCVRAMVRAWEVSQPQVAELREASMAKAVMEAKGQTKQ